MASKAVGEGELSKRRRLDYAGDTAIVLLSGDKRVTVHSNILCRSSTLLRTRYEDGQSKQTKPIFIYLPMGESEFLTYVHWLYTGELELPGANWPVTNEANTGGHSKPEMGKIVPCYLLGQHIGDNRFCNAVVDRLMEYWRMFKNTFNEKRAPTPDFVALVAENSGLGRLVLDLFISSDKEKRDLIDYPPDFVHRLAEALLEERDTGLSRDPERQTRCYYHEHKDDTDGCQERDLCR